MGNDSMTSPGSPAKVRELKSTSKISSIQIAKTVLELIFYLNSLSFSINLNHDT
jgi:hypothetical protein